MYVCKYSCTYVHKNGEKGATLSDEQQAIFYLKHPTDRIVYTTAYERTLSGMRNSSMGPPRATDLTTHHTMREHYHRDASRSLRIMKHFEPLGHTGPNI